MTTGNRNSRWTRVGQVKAKVKVKYDQGYAYSLGKVKEKVRACVSSFEEMPVWQKAMDLAEQVFAITASEKRGLRFDLADPKFSVICFS
jgi:hypothetical protein